MFFAFVTEYSCPVIHIILIYIGSAEEGNFNNYLILSIMTTIFCCLPLGIVAIVFSTQVSSCKKEKENAASLTIIYFSDHLLQAESEYKSGNTDVAKSKARIAKILSFVGIGIGSFLAVVYLIIVIAVAAVNAQSATQHNYT